MLGRVTLPETEIYHVLSNSRRRETLSLLWRNGESLSLREISEQIAESESGQTPAPRALRESVYNALHQTHLPKLAALGLISYDPNRKIIRTVPEAGYIGRYMDVTTRMGFTWGEYYRALGVFGLFVTVSSLADTPVMGAIDPLVPSTLFLGVFAASTAYQMAFGTHRLRGTYRRRKTQLRESLRRGG